MPDLPNVTEIVQDGYKKPFIVLAVVMTTVIAVVGGLTKAEAFVDGRIELRLSEQRKTAEAQERRLQRIEEQFSGMKETLTEIRADVRVLRARVEIDWNAPASAGPPAPHAVTR